MVLRSFLLRVRRNPIGSAVVGTVLISVALVLPATASAPTPAPTTGVSYPTAVLADSPAGYWRLGETSGTTVADSSGHSNSGTLTGAVTLGGAGALIGDTDTAATFAGGSINTTYTQTSVSAYTVEAWVKTTTTAAWQQVLSDRGVTGSTGKSLTLALNNNVSGCTGVAGAPFFAADSDGLFIGVQSTTPINDGKWHHLAGVWSGVSGSAVTPGQFLIYVDGVTVPVSTCSVGGATAPLTGREGTWIGPGFYGTIDEAAVYTTALTPSQIANHIQASGNLPGAPAISLAAAGANQATVTWIAPLSSGGDTITGYTVETYSGTAATNAQATGVQTSATVTGLRGGLPYTAQTRAVNRFGIGPASARSAAVTPTGATTTYASTVIADAPNAYWRLGDASGSLIADSSGHGNYGLQSGSVTRGSTTALVGDADPSMTFGGGRFDTNYVQTAATAYSVEAWINTTSTGQWLNIIKDNGIVAATGNGLTLGLNNGACSGVAGAPFFALDTSGTFVGIQSQVGINDGNWHHLVGTWQANGGVDSAQFKIYVDGQAVTNNVNCRINNSVSAPLTGKDGTLIGAGFAGSLDEVAVYPTVLTPGQINTHLQGAGYTPGAPQNVTASGGPNTATVSWTAGASGKTAITSYTATASLNGSVVATQSPGPAATSATFINLGGGDYTLAVYATNSWGTGPTGSASATASGPAAGSGLGQMLYYKTSGNPAFPSGTASVVTQTSLPAMSTWTVEGWIGKFQSYATTESAGGWGSATGSNAGISWDSGGAWRWTYPGGAVVSFNPACGGSGLMCHYAISYDGTTVRGFVNGIQSFSAATTTAALPSAGFGVSDYAITHQLLLDETRVSSVARYTSNFRVMDSAYGTDSNTVLLWHMDDYKPGQLAQYTVDGGGSSYVKQQFLSDASGNGRSAQLSFSSNGHTCCPEQFTFFSAAQGVASRSRRAEPGGLRLSAAGHVQAAGELRDGRVLARLHRRGRARPGVQPQLLEDVLIGIGGHQWPPRLRLERQLQHADDLRRFRKRDPDRFHGSGDPLHQAWGHLRGRSQDPVNAGSQWRRDLRADQAGQLGAEIRQRRQTALGDGPQWLRHHPRL